MLWDGISPTITFDLGAVYTYSSVMAYFKFYATAAVYMPGSIALRFSDDGSTFGATQVRTLTGAERIGSDNTDGVFELLTSADSGRYVELTLNNGPENRWLALAEVTFDGTPGGVTQEAPEPGSVHLVGIALLGLLGAGARCRSKPA